MGNEIENARGIFKKLDKKLRLDTHEIFHDKTTHLDSTRSTSLTPRSRFLMKQLGGLLLTRLHKLKALTTHLGCIYRTAGETKFEKNPKTY